MKIMVMDVDGDFFVFDDTAFSVQADRGPKGWDVDIYNDLAPDGDGITFADGLTEEGARKHVKTLWKMYGDTVEEGDVTCLRLWFEPAPEVGEGDTSDDE